MTDLGYANYSALDPFFEVVMRGLADNVDGTHYFDTIADNAVFEFRYNFPGFPTRVVGREALMALYAPYGESTTLQRGYGLVVHHSQDPRVLILEYVVRGIKVPSGKAYENRFISVVTIEGRQIVHWRDYMDSLAEFTAATDA